MLRSLLLFHLVSANVTGKEVMSTSCLLSTYTRDDASESILQDYSLPGVLVSTACAYRNAGDTARQDAISSCRLQLRPGSSRLHFLLLPDRN